MFHKLLTLTKSLISNGNFRHILKTSTLSARTSISPVGIPWWYGHSRMRRWSTLDKKRPLQILVSTRRVKAHLSCLTILLILLHSRPTPPWMFEPATSKYYTQTLFSCPTGRRLTVPATLMTDSAVRSHSTAFKLAADLKHRKN